MAGNLVWAKDPEEVLKLDERKLAELRTTGTLWAAAKRETTARGWKVAEKLPTSFEVRQASAQAPAR